MNVKDLVFTPNQETDFIIKARCSNGCCPTVSYLANNPKDKQVVIKDDFKQKVFMSIEQFNSIVQQAASVDVLLKK